MTQLSLFDTPASIAPNSISTSSVVSGNLSATPTMVAPVVTTPGASRLETAAEPPAHREGLNHMGDLAKLVLMRYELAAKRRADAATRRRRAR